MISYITNELRKNCKHSHVIFLAGMERELFSQFHRN